MPQRTGIANRLVGRVVMKGRDFSPGDQAWPVNDPNLSNEHLATIEAVWTDKDGGLKALFRTPRGITFEGWVVHHTLLPINE